MVGPNWDKPAEPEEKLRPAGTLQRNPPNNDKPPTYLFKIIIVGDETVGKTSFLRRFTDDTFSPQYSATIGVDFAVKVVETAKNEVVKLQVWDTAGQERFRSMTSSYYRGGHGVVLMFDVTKRPSFLHLSNWLTQIQSFSNDDTTIVLVGNKADEDEGREVGTDEALKFAHENDLQYFEASAKDDVNIVNAMEALCTANIERVQRLRAQKKENGLNDSVKVSPQRQTKQQGPPPVRRPSVEGPPPVRRPSVEGPPPARRVSVINLSDYSTSKPKKSKCC
ncbi:ras-related protein Rab-35 [Aplysia californica]|uniref:Ras-related protein Rab-35 n=1 Tax=Aplysia californica TaxID=6500 RepID=A0ABM0JNT2_APLCA|nr:ras-related protein Rab-35 [Aplysia californica]